jgi:hypothetical protein
VGSGGRQQSRTIFIQHHDLLSKTVATTLRFLLYDGDNKTLPYQNPPNLATPPRLFSRSTRNEGVGGTPRLLPTLDGKPPRTSNSFDTTDASIRNTLQKKRGFLVVRRPPTVSSRVETPTSEGRHTPTFRLQPANYPSISGGELLSSEIRPNYFTSFDSANYGNQSNPSFYRHPIHRTTHHPIHHLTHRSTHHLYRTDRSPSTTRPNRVEPNRVVSIRTGSTGTPFRPVFSPRSDLFRSARRTRPISRETRSSSSSSSIDRDGTRETRF